MMCGSIYLVGGNTHAHLEFALTMWGAVGGEIVIGGGGGRDDFRDIRPLPCETGIRPKSMPVSTTKAWTAGKSESRRRKHGS